MTGALETLTSRASRPISRPHWRGSIVTVPGGGQVTRGPCFGRSLLLRLVAKLDTTCHASCMQLLGQEASGSSGEARNVIQPITLRWQICKSLSSCPRILLNVFFAFAIRCLHSCRPQHIAGHSLICNFPSSRVTEHLPLPATPVCGHPKRVSDVARRQFSYLYITVHERLQSLEDESGEIALHQASYRYLCCIYSLARDP